MMQYVNRLTGGEQHILARGASDVGILRLKRGREAILGLQIFAQRRSHHLVYVIENSLQVAHRPSLSRPCASSLAALVLNLHPLPRPPDAIARAEYLIQKS